MAEAVYVLCILTSLLCAILLLRAFQRTRMRLLLWTGLCFFGLCLNNFFLFLDLRIFPHVDLTLPRNLTGLLAIGILVYGLVWETE